MTQWGMRVEYIDLVLKQPIYASYRDRSSCFSNVIR